MSAGNEWMSLRRRLEALGQSVAAEIRTYPRPITACDAQFNHLLELRRLLPLELQRLDAAAREPGGSIGEFLSGSPCAADLPERVGES